MRDGVHQLVFVGRQEDRAFRLEARRRRAGRHDVRDPAPGRGDDDVRRRTLREAPLALLRRVVPVVRDADPVDLDLVGVAGNIPLEAHEVAELHARDLDRLEVVGVEDDDALARFVELGPVHTVRHRARQHERLPERAHPLHEREGRVVAVGMGDDEHVADLGERLPVGIRPASLRARERVGREVDEDRVLASLQDIGHVVDVPCAQGTRRDLRLAHLAENPRDRPPRVGEDRLLESLGLRRRRIRREVVDMKRIVEEQQRPASVRICELRALGLRKARFAEAHRLVDPVREVRLSFDPVGERAVAVLPREANAVRLQFRRRLWRPVKGCRRKPHTARHEQAQRTFLNHSLFYQKSKTF